MSNGNPVAATAYSSYPGSNQTSVLWVAGQWHAPGVAVSTESVIWLAVLDLTTLDLVASALSDGSTVPADIASYAGNPQYYLYAISNSAEAGTMPQGDLYTLLQKVGSGPRLAALEQIYATIGTGLVGYFSYILAATLGESDEPGFEELSMDHEAILTMSFLPTTVGGQTIYAPVQVG